jgi:hypothetical protein
LPTPIVDSTVDVNIGYIKFVITVIAIIIPTTLAQDMKAVTAATLSDSIVQDRMCGNAPVWPRSGKGDRGAMLLGHRITKRGARDKIRMAA